MQRSSRREHRRSRSSQRASDWWTESVRSMSAAVEQLGEAMQWRVGAVTCQMIEDRLAQIAVQRPGQYGGAHVKGGASTANVCRRILHEALQIAVHERAIPFNPADREGRKFKPVVNAFAVYPLFSTGFFIYPPLSPRRAALEFTGTPAH
ncbi:hypothetical protein [uncultured Kocuria sp.]|uniref:hypothetical protein n=1 Tax=uncultured Kocuria sp. TaxID=259305 RepID=UPI0026352306|nr:hypothetical protein [uncultured Kocuria sp.]